MPGMWNAGAKFAAAVTAVDTMGGARRTVETGPICEADRAKRHRKVFSRAGDSAERNGASGIRDRNRDDCGSLWLCASDVFDEVPRDRRIAVGDCAGVYRDAGAERYGG